MEVIAEEYENFIGVCSVIDKNMRRKKMQYNFDQELERSNLHTMKWENVQHRKNNPNMLCFGTAEMDFKAAPPILEAFQKVVDNGHFGYPYKREGYYDAVISWFKRHCDFEIKREWIANSIAIYPSFQGLIEGLSEASDEVIFHSPVHFVFSDIIRSLRRIPVENPLKIENGKYVMDFDDLKKKITKKTKLFILCNPHNPVGRAWTVDELKTLMDICIENNVVVISDEVYFGLIYKGKKYTPIASLSKEASMNSVTCISPSKSYNLTGIKHSLVVTENSDILQKYKDELHKNNEFFGESVFGHAAVEAAFGKCDDWSEQLMDYIEGNYHTVRSFMEHNMPDVYVFEPDATYFLWMDFSCLHMSNEELQALFEDEACVEVSQGYTLGTGGSGYIRLNVATQRKILAEGLERIKQAYDHHMEK